METCKLALGEPIHVLKRVERPRKPEPGAARA
jgi:hypothetical protein